MGEQILNKKIEIRKNFVFLTLIVCILIIIQIQNSFALELTNVEYTWMDEPITLVSNNNIVPVKISFQYTLAQDEIVKSITLDATGMQSDITQQHYYSSISINPASCMKRNETYTCKVTKNSINKYLSMKINDPSVTTKITFTLSDDTIIEKVDTKTFTIDNTRPKVTSIKSEKCDSDDRCYAAAGIQNKFTIQMQDSQATFDRKIVAFEVGSEVSYVSDCQSMSCYGYAVPVCNVATPLSLRIVPFRRVSSQDDAGNPIIQDLAYSVICDPDLPEIIDDSLTVISNSGENVLTTNGQATISLQVKETTSPSLSIEVNAGAIGGPNATGNCVETQISNIYDCAVSFQPSNAVAGTFNLPVKVTDLAGNSASATASLTLYESSEKASVNAWAIKSVTQSNNVLDAVNMIYERDVMIYLELTPKLSGAEIVSANSGGNCVAQIEGSTGVSGDISALKVSRIDKENKKLYLTATIAGHGGDSKRYANYGRLTYICPININSKAGSYYYTVPEQENITLDFEIINDKTFGTYVQDEITSTQESLEGVKSIVDTYYSTFSTVESACMMISKTKNLVAGMGGILSAMGIAANTLGIVDMGSSRAAAQAWSSSISSVDSVANSLGAIVGPVCQFFTCDGGAQDMLNGAWDDWGFSNDLAKIGGYDSSSAVLNPYKSLFVAVTSFCAPAIIYHMQIDMGIDCTYMECMSNKVPNMGFEPSTCSEQKEYSTCIHTWSNVLNFLPLTALFKDVTGRLADIFEDPVTFFGTSGITAACKLFPEFVGEGNCYTVKGIAAGLESMNTVQSMFLPRRRAGQACDYVIDRIDPRTKIWKIDEDTATKMINPNDAKYARPITKKAALNPDLDIQIGICKAGICQHGDLGKMRFTVSDVEPGLTPKDDQIMVYDDNKYIGTVADVLGDASEYKVALNRYNEEKTLYDIRTRADEKKLFYESLSNHYTQHRTESLTIGSQILAPDQLITAMENAKLESERLNNEYRALVSDFINKYDDVTDVNAVEEIFGKFLTFNKRPPAEPELSEYIMVNGKIDDVKLANYEKMQQEVKDYQDFIYDTLVQEYGEELVKGDGPSGNPGMYNLMLELNDARVNRDKYNLQSDLYNLFSKIGEKSDELIEMKRKLDTNEVGPKNIDDFKKEIKELEKEIDKDKKNYASLNEKYEEKFGGEEIVPKVDEDGNPISGDEKAEELENKIAYLESYGNWHRTIKTFWGLGSGLTTLKRTFQADWGTWDSLGLKFMDQVADQLRIYSDIEKEICAINSFEDDIADSTGNAVINIGHQGSFETGAFISGRRAIKVLEDQTKINQYWISGAIASKKNAGLKFKITLLGESNKDITAQIPTLGTSPVTLNLGQMVSFGGTNTYYFEDPGVYNEVCIEFTQKGNDLRRYFDNVFGMDDGKYCQKLVVEEYVR